MAIWFTSDTHFGHKNINKYSSRPFSTVEEMDEALLENINARVRHDDTLYHLGDFAFGNGHLYRDAIKCRNIVLVYGNHDKEIRRDIRLRNRFKVATDYLEDTIRNQFMVLCHYSFRVWNRSHHGSWHLYGHSHGSLPDDPNSLSFDVGVDCWNYRPLHFDEVREIIGRKTWGPADHHGNRSFEVAKRCVR